MKFDFSFLLPSLPALLSFLVGISLPSGKDDSLDYICDVILLTIYFSSKDKKRVELTDIRASVDSHLKENIDGQPAFVGIGHYDINEFANYRIIRSQLISIFQVTSIQNRMPPTA